MREMSAFRGAAATNYFGIMSDMENTMSDKMRGQMKGKTVHINRMFVVSQKCRKRGIGSYFLTQTVQAAMASGCDAFYFCAPNAHSQKLASKINLKEYNYIRYDAYANTYPKYKELEDIEESCKGYLALFKPLD